MPKRKAKLLQEWTKDVVELMRSNPESFDERLEGHRGGGGEQDYLRVSCVSPSSTTPSFEKKKLMFGDGGGQPKAMDFEDFGSGDYGAHPRLAGSNC